MIRNEPPISPDDRCITIEDVLKHKFVLNSIKKIYNRYYSQRDWYDKISFEQVKWFMERIFSEEDLYQELITILRSKYSRFRWKINQQQINSCFNALEFLRDIFKRDSIELDIQILNEKIYELVRESLIPQSEGYRRRENLINRGIPLLDMDWNDVTWAISWDEVNHHLWRVEKFYFSWETPLMLVDSGHEGNYDDHYDDDLIIGIVLSDRGNSGSLSQHNFYVYTSDWKPVYNYKREPLKSDDISKVYIIRDKVLFRLRDSWYCLFDQYWHKYLGLDRLLIYDIHWMYRLWDRTYLEVTYVDEKGTFFIDIDTKEELRIKKEWVDFWFPDELFHDKEPVKYNWKYYYFTRCNEKTFLVDQHWNALTDEDWNLAYWYLRDSDFLLCYLDYKETIS